MDKPTLWTKNFLIVTFVNFFVALNFYLLMIVISEFAMTKFDAPPGTEAGLAAGIFVFGSLIARLLAGRYINRAGQKKVLYLGLFVGLITTSLYFCVTSIPLLLVIRFLHGTSFGIASTAAGTIVANIIPKDRCGEGIGYYCFSITLATAIGPFLGLILIQHGSYNVIFAVCTIVSVFSIAMAFFLSIQDAKLTKEQLTEMKKFKLSNFIEPKVLQISIVCMIIFFCYSSVISFLSEYAKEIDLVEAASYFYIVFAIVILSSRPVIGRLFDTKGENLVMYSAIAIFAAGMIVFSNAHVGTMLLLAAVLIGLGYGVCNPVVRRSLLSQ